MAKFSLEGICNRVWIRDYAKSLTCDLGMKEPNGKEMPHARFNKFTSHIIVKELKLNSPELLPLFKVEDGERNFRIWQRDPLAILMDSRDKFEQKLTYLHNNPLQERWGLVDRPESYQLSSARFYEDGVDDFGFWTHYMDKF